MVVRNVYNVESCLERRGILSASLFLSLSPPPTVRPSLALAAAVLLGVAACSYTLGAAYGSTPMLQRGSIF